MQSPDPAVPVIAAAALLSAPVSFLSSRRHFVPREKYGLLILAPLPGYQKNNPPARNKYSRTHFGQHRKKFVVFPLVLYITSALGVQAPCQETTGNIHV